MHLQRACEFALEEVEDFLRDLGDGENSFGGSGARQRLRANTLFASRLTSCANEGSRALWSRSFRRISPPPASFSPMVERLMAREWALAGKSSIAIGSNC